ncbi:hypothetical protein ACFQ9X_54610 [Catenulispora yoronensis]
MSAPHEDDDRTPVPPDGDGWTPTSLDGDPGLDDSAVDALGALLRERMQQAVAGLEPQGAALEMLRRAVPARRRRRHAALATTAVTVFAVGAGAMLAARGSLLDPRAEARRRHRGRQPDEHRDQRRARRRLRTRAGSDQRAAEHRVGVAEQRDGDVGDVVVADHEGAAAVGVVGRTGLRRAGAVAVSEFLGVLGRRDADLGGRHRLRNRCRDSEIGLHADRDAGLERVGWHRLWRYWRYRRYRRPRACDAVQARSRGDAVAGRAAVRADADPRSRRPVRVPLRLGAFGLRGPAVADDRADHRRDDGIPGQSDGGADHPGSSGGAVATPTGPTPTRPTPAWTTATSTAPAGSSYSVSYAVSGTQSQQTAIFSAACGAALYVTDYFPPDGKSTRHGTEGSATATTALSAAH